MLVRRSLGLDPITGTIVTSLVKDLLVPQQPPGPSPADLAAAAAAQQEHTIVAIVLVGAAALAAVILSR